MKVGQRPPAHIRGVFVAVAALLALPILLLLWQLTGGTTDTWQHLSRTVLPTYIYNTVVLCLGTGTLAVILGISTAWLVSRYRFSGSRWLGWALVLPLALPSYIVAYTYGGIVSYTGPLQRWSRGMGWATDALVPFELMSLPGATVLLALVLYPYVYLLSRTLFQRQSSRLLQAASLLGASGWRTFWQVGLPLVRPAAAAGTALVLMEVLNDYGAVKYFGVPTFTTGIFRAWFSMSDLTSAVRLSGLLIVLVAVALALERWGRGSRRYTDSRTATPPASPEQLSSWRGVLAILWCGLPVALGFVIPLLQLGSWALSYGSRAFTTELWRTIANTFVIGGASAGIILAVALLIGYIARYGRGRVLTLLVRTSTLGYAVPGAVIAVGVLAFTTTVDRAGALGTLFLTGSIIALIYAYAVRFMAVAFGSVESGYEQLPPSLHQVAQVLGSGSRRAYFRVELPLLRRAAIAGALLTFVDVLKELPLTLILRPFDYDTLATKAYELANDEQVASSAIYALLIVGVGLLPVLGLHRILQRGHQW